MQRIRKAIICIKNKLIDFLCFIVLTCKWIDVILLLITGTGLIYVGVLLFREF